MRNFEFDEVIVFTDKTEYWSKYRTCSVNRIQSIEDYNILILKVVPFYVNTEFFIVAQFDGFILNGAAFTSEFYNYDYIGAPWPIAAYPHFRVGNGGFSWRSRKLALAAASLADFRLPPESEDAFIGRVLRIALEDRFQCQFPGEEIASCFSFEMLLPSGPVFGFHGLMHLPIVYSNNLPYLIENLPSRAILHKKDVLASRITELSDDAQDLYWSLYHNRIQSI